MSWLDFAVGVAIAVGVLGVVVPLLPGSLLVGAAIGVWAIATGGPTAWVVFGVAVTFLVSGTVVKYLVPGRSLQAAGVPTRSLVVGAALAVAGLFVVPVIGAPLGFVLGVYLAELQRLGSNLAWPSTRAALKAVGLSILIETTACALAAATWTVGVVAT